MKNILVLFLALVGIAYSDGPVLRNAQTNSTTLFPAAGSLAVTPWTNTIPVIQGQLIKASNTRSYMAVIAGTSTNEPSHAQGDEKTLDAVHWYAVPAERSSFYVLSQSATPVYISLGAPAVVGAGVRLLSNEVFTANYEGAVYVASSATGAVSALGW